MIPLILKLLSQFFQSFVPFCAKKDVTIRVSVTIWVSVTILGVTIMSGYSIILRYYNNQITILFSGSLYIGLIGFIIKEIEFYLLLNVFQPYVQGQREIAVYHVLCMRLR